VGHAALACWRQIDWSRCREQSRMLRESRRKLVVEGGHRRARGRAKRFWCNWRIAGMHVRVAGRCRRARDMRVCDTSCSKMSCLARGVLLLGSLPQQQLVVVLVVCNERFRACIPATFVRPSDNAARALAVPWLFRIGRCFRHWRACGRDGRSKQQTRRENAKSNCTCASARCAHLKHLQIHRASRRRQDRQGRE
jgi:hypothetical protein